MPAFTICDGRFTIRVQMNDLDHLRRVWQTLGRDDPLWAVLSQADKRGRRWKPDEFLATGRAEVETQLNLLGARGWPVSHTLALDFGCPSTQGLQITQYFRAD